MKTSTTISYSNLREIPAYWHFSNGKYFYCEGAPFKADFLPTINIEYKCILEEHGILYLQISDTELELWDESCYEEVDVTLPTFIRWEGGYRRVKDHTGTVITKEAQDAAYKLYHQVVLPAIDEFEEKKRKEELEAELKQKQEEKNRKLKELDNKLVNAMGESNTAVMHDVYIDIPDEGIFLSSNGKNIKAFNVFVLSNIWEDRIYTNVVIAFDMDKLPSSGYLELQVPKGEAGMFIGREGWQVKMWAKALGLKYIYVTEKEE